MNDPEGPMIGEWIIVDGSTVCRDGDSCTNAAHRIMCESILIINGSHMMFTCKDKYCCLIFNPTSPNLSVAANKQSKLLRYTFTHSTYTLYNKQIKYCMIYHLFLIINFLTLPKSFVFLNLLNASCIKLNTSPITVSNICNKSSNDILSTLLLLFCLLFL